MQTIDFVHLLMCLIIVISLMHLLLSATLHRIIVELGKIYSSNRSEFYTFAIQYIMRASATVSAIMVLLLLVTKEWLLALLILGTMFYFSVFLVNFIQIVTLVIMQGEIK